MPGKKKKGRKSPRGSIRMRRRGGYLSDAWNGFKSWSRGAGKPVMDIGTQLAGQFFPGSDYILKGLRTILGTGAYSGAGGSVPYMASPVPDMHSAIDFGVRITHKEFIADVTSSTAFQLDTYQINPGLPAVFPWLSSVARCFQKYELRGLAFVFKSTSATALNSTNTALGTMIGATQYAVYANDPTSKQTMLNLAGARDGKPAESNIFPIECARKDMLTKNLLVRTGVVADDLQKYDHGKFHLATIGSQAAATVGELHVCYDIILRQPIQPVIAGGSYFSDATDAKNASPLGTQVKVVGDLPVESTSQLIRLPTGNVNPYFVEIIWHGSQVAITLPTFILNYCTLITNLEGGNTGSFVSPDDASTTRHITKTFLIQPTYADVAATIEVGTAGTLPSSLEHVTISVISFAAPQAATMALLQQWTRERNLRMDNDYIPCARELKEEFEEKKELILSRKPPPIPQMRR